MMKKNLCCSENMAAVGLLALRISVAIIFINAGWMKLHMIDQVAAMFGNMGIPLAGIMAYVVALVEFLGGIAVLLGVYTKEVSKVLAFTMLVALLLAHRSGPLQAATPALAMLGSTLALAGVGAGKWRLVKNESCCKTKECCGKESCDGKHNGKK